MKRSILFGAFLFLCPALSAQEKLRIYITDVPTWTLQTRQSGNAGIAIQGTNSDVLVREKSQSLSTTTIEKKGSLVPKARNYFHSQKDCAGLAMTVDAEKADYAFVFGGRDAWDRNNVNVMVVELATKEIIYAGDAIRFKNVVKDACKAVKKARAEVEKSRD